MAASAEIEEEQHGLAVKLPYQLGRFTLCRELGAGGMATVYLGRMRMAEGFDRLVALKTIHGHLARAQTFVDMFLDEAKIASQISHPNVCSVYDFGNLGGTYYLALEYLTGEPLHEFINKVVERKSDDLMQALPYLAARIIADACEGLHAAHETRGSDGTRLDIVHRDVSPQNLFVTYDGAVKVVDFGCAKAIQRVTQTDTGIMKGKVSYAAPEQLRAGDIDQRVDVWALGVCLWETLTLKELFRRETAIVSAMAVLEERIPRADEVCSWVPRQLADIAAKALERDPNARYASARQLGRDLRAFIARAGVSFESAELAEWMEYLFAERQREVLAMVAEVEARTSTPAARSAPTDDDDKLGVGAAPTKLAKISGSGAWHEVSATSSAERPKRALRLDPDPDDPVVLPTRSRGWLWATLLVLLLGGGAYGGMRYAGVGPFATASEGDEPQPIASDPGTHATAPVEPAEPSATEEQAAAEDPAAQGTEVAAPEAAPGDDAEAPAVEPAEAAHETAEAAHETAEAPREAPPRHREREEHHADHHEPSAPTPSQEHAAEPTTPRGPSISLDTSQGQVVVTAEGGWAQVYLGERSLGRTPLRVSLPVGQQRLRLLPYGHEPAQYVVVPVAWGEINSVSFHVGPPPSDDAPPDEAGDGT